jgi:hypothetical protein
MPLHLHGIITPGHGVASGRSAASPYPQGSIAMQAPFFKARGLDLSGCLLATLNVSIAPATWQLLRPGFRFEGVLWTALHPAETFSFLQCQLTHRAAQVSGWLYYPHPETKARHWQSASVMEIIAPPLDNLSYGDSIELAFDDGTLAIDGMPPGS